MTSFVLPAVATGTRLEVLKVGAAPLVRRLLDQLDLPGLFQRRLPALPGPSPDLPTATVLGVLLSNLLLARQPLYGLAAWANAFVPEHLGLVPGQTPLLNDDRCGRALDHLHKADRASLLTAVVLQAIRVFGLQLSQLHQDTTTITLCGEYANQPSVHQVDRPVRICRGYNKDHRPDLKQLVYNRTITADGAVPIHCKVHDGNTPDDHVHRDTWLALRQLIGTSDFLYVADSKFCSKDNMSLIAGQHGRFLTVMPKTRAEDGRFRAWVQDHDVNWSEVLRKVHPRGQNKPQVVYQGWEDPQGSQEGYRILWYHSCQKHQRDQEARRKKLSQARKRLLRLRPRGRGEHFSTEQAAREAAERVLTQAGVGDWLRVRIEEVVRTEHVQVGPGRPGPQTLYRQVQTTTYQVAVEDNEEAQRRAARCDGLFPLMSNDKSLSVAEALAKYKYQPYAEKRHAQLKSVFGVVPMWLRKPQRVEALLWLYHVVEVVQSLLEREVRRHMQQGHTKSLPLYPEGRSSAAPTAELVLGVFAGQRRYQMLNEDGHLLHTAHDPLPESAERLVSWLGVERAAYGLPPARGGGGVR